MTLKPNENDEDEKYKDVEDPARMCEPPKKRPKHKHPSFKRNVFDYFSEYSNNTGIHGFKYMGEQDRSLVEKLWWLILFAISLYICIDLIIQTYLKWESSPVLVSFARSPTPVWQIPFPAITICSETKAKQRAFNYTYAYNEVQSMIKGQSYNMSDEDLKKFSDISLICDSHLYNAGNKTTEFDTIEYLISIAPTFEDTFWVCRWTSVNESCHNFFTPMLTEEGLCFTFNMQDRSEIFNDIVYFNNDYMTSERKTEGWTLEKGYPKTNKKDTIPRRAISAGAGAGLFLLLASYEQDLDYACRGPVQGFKVLLHNPAEVPRVGNQYFRAPLNQEVIVSVKPDMMTTSEGLRVYDSHRRQCYFPQERSLLYFKNYTQQNCQVECLTNFTYERCGCVAYHMPHSEEMEICGSGSIQCMFDANNELLGREVETGLSNEDGTSANPSSSDCDCLPSCISLNYNAETSQADFNWPKVYEAFQANLSESPGLQLTRITIFFKEMQFITSERNELYGQTDFLANCGGLLGLFTGFSFLSIVEIIYFLTLRLLCNVKKYGRHYWSGSENLIHNDRYFHK